MLFMRQSHHRWALTAFCMTSVIQEACKTPVLLPSLDWVLCRKKKNTTSAAGRKVCLCSMQNTTVSALLAYTQLILATYVWLMHLHVEETCPHNPIPGAVSWISGLWAWKHLVKDNMRLTGGEILLSLSMHCHWHISKNKLLGQQALLRLKSAKQVCTLEIRTILACCLNSKHQFDVCHSQEEAVQSWTPPGSCKNLHSTQCWWLFYVLCMLSYLVCS